MTIHASTPERFGDKISKILFHREIDRCNVIRFENDKPGTRIFSKVYRNIKKGRSVSKFGCRVIFLKYLYIE